MRRRLTLNNCLTGNYTKFRYFCSIVIRPFLSYVLSGLILLTQVGIPLHKHYCKGMLESVSVFYAQKCTDHEAEAKPDACCKKEGTSNCSSDNNPCCSHEVTVVSQQASYLTPSMQKWIAVAAMTYALYNISPEIVNTPMPAVDTEIVTDTGPPLYILHQSLIIYA